MSLQGALAALLLRGPAHGYELLSALDAELGPLWATRPSQVYTTLGRLIRDGLARSERVPQPNRPDRQVFTLTASGRAFGESYLFDDGPADELVVRLAIARMVAPDRFPELVDVMTEQRSAALHGLRQVRTDSKRGFQPEALAVEIRRIEAEIRWLVTLRDNSAEIVARPPARTEEDQVEQFG
ncbi:MAG: hypothetical protein DLM71_03560 [Chloroflexi bacterium]|nr:MAG: hypothetical protein DLM71_03560 [Chloroflexota bacterium]